MVTPLKVVPNGEEVNEPNRLAATWARLGLVLHLRQTLLVASDVKCT